MELITKLLKDPFQVIQLLLLLIIAIILLFIAFRLKTANKKGREKLFKSLDINFSRDMINDKEDIRILIAAVSRKVEREYSIASILEDYLLYLTDKDKQDKAQYTKAYLMIKSLITEENSIKPFEGLPEEEKRVLQSIKTAITHKDLSSISYNLHELSSVLATRNRIYKRTTRFNRLTIPVAVLGIALTIIFGWLNLYPQRNYLKEIKKINKQLIEVMILNGNENNSNIED